MAIIEHIHKDSAHIETTQITKERSYSRTQYVLLLSILCLTLTVSVITVIVFLTKHVPYQDEQERFFKNERDPATNLPHTTNSVPDYPNVNLTLPDKVWMVKREQWLARPTKNPYSPLALPVPYVIIMYTESESCNVQADCTFTVSYIQNFHMDSRGWDDIGYSFLVGGDGYAYEGRGWNNVGAQVYGYNTKCIGIAFIGTFNTIMPPERQIKAAKQLIEIGLEEGYIAKDYKLLAARQLQTTRSPGLTLYEDVKKWPHWAEAP